MSTGAGCRCFISCLVDEQEIQLTTIVLCCCNYIQFITVTYYKPGQVLQMGVNIHVAFSIDTLDFETHRTNVVTDTVGETEAQVYFQSCLSSLVCGLTFKRKVSTLYHGSQNRNAQVSIFSCTNQHMLRDTQKDSWSLKEWPRCHNAVPRQVNKCTSADMLQLLLVVVVETLLARPSQLHAPVSVWPLTKEEELGLIVYCSGVVFLSASAL